MIKKLIIPFILILTSCEREIYIDPVDVEQELVVSAIIHSAEGDSLLLSSTFSAYNDAGVSNANIAVTHMNDTIGRYVEKSEGLYFYHGEAFQEKKDYGLSIEHPDYTGVTSKTTVPDVPDIWLETYSQNGEKTIDNNDLSIDFQVLLAFADELNTENYYMITASSTFEIVLSVGFPDERDSIVVHKEAARLNSKSPIVEITGNHNGYGLVKNNIDWEGLYLPWKDEVVFSDNLFKDQKIVIPLDLSVYMLQNTSKVMITLTSINEEYFQLLRSLAANMKNRESFFTEAIEMYSNINNGYGIWAAKSSKTVSIEIDGAKIFNDKYN